MSEMKHTPGPWEVKESSADESDFIVAEPTGNTVAETNFGVYADAGEFDPSVRRITLAEAKANARLIAAAPAMLKELTEAEPLLMALCSVALRKDVQDFLPHGLLIRAETWLRHSDAQAVIRLAKGQDR